MNSKVDINWGIIGCGNVTEVKSGPAYQQVPNFTLSAVMRRNEILAKDYAERHNVEKYSSNADNIINDELINAVYIATPPDTHKLYGLQVAEARKPCCIEKPLAPTYDDCKEIVEAFDKAGVPLFVAYYRRSLPRFNKVKSLLDDCEIGNVRHISWHLSEPASQMDLSQEYNWRTDQSIAPGGYFDDVACHGLNLFSYFFGDFEKVKGISLNQQKLYSAFDAVSACWSHKNGVTGSGSWNFGTGSRQDSVTIYGEKGEITFSIFDENPVVIHKATQQEEFTIAHPENTQLYHVQNMREYLLAGQPHPSMGLSAAHTNWVMDHILKNDS